MSAQRPVVIPPTSVNRGALLSLKLSSDGPVTLITMSGEVDMSTTHLLTELVQQLTRERPERVVVDMAEVTFFCADGLRALIRASDTIASAGGQLLLRAPSAPTRRVLAITDTNHLFPLDAANGVRRNATTTPR